MSAPRYQGGYTSALKDTGYDHTNHREYGLNALKVPHILHLYYTCNGISRVQEASQINEYIRYGTACCSRCIQPLLIGQETQTDRGVRVHVAYDKKIYA